MDLSFQNTKNVLSSFKNSGRKGQKNLAQPIDNSESSASGMMTDECDKQKSQRWPFQREKDQYWNVYI